MRATLLNQTSPCYRTFPLQLFQIEFVHFVRCGKLFCNFHVRSALISRFPHQIRRLSSLKTDHSLLNATESLSHGCLITIFISLPFCGQQCYICVPSKVRPCYHDLTWCFRWCIWITMKFWIFECLTLSLFRIPFLFVFQFRGSQALYSIVPVMEVVATLQTVMRWYYGAIKTMCQLMKQVLLPQRATSCTNVFVRAKNVCREKPSRL